MPVKDLYYNKYLKYKNKYLNLQSQIGGSPPELPTPEPPEPSAPPEPPTPPPPLSRQLSEYISCQGQEGTCWAHATTRLFIKLMLTFLSEKLTKFSKELSEINCNHYYDTTKCSNNETNIFDCFLQIKKGKIYCNSLEGNKKDTGWSEQNLYALLFHFIFSTLVEQFGRNNGAYDPQTTCLYILDYLKYIKITKYSIAITLGYDSTKYDDLENEYFDKLINDLNEFFKIIKTNLNNKFFDPIIYIYENSNETKMVASIYDYYYSSKNFKSNANDYEIIASKRLSFKEKYDKKNPFSSKIENLNPKYTTEHNLKKFTKTTNLKQTMEYVLDNDKPYYVILLRRKHVVIITHYSKDKDNEDNIFLHIKNSWGIQSCEKTSKWCDLINHNGISIKLLDEDTTPYSIIFFYPYTFTKDQEKTIKEMYNPKNTQLTFRKSEINYDKIKEIVYGLIQTTTVTIDLILSDCNIGDMEAIAISDALVINRTLQKLTLRQNRISEIGANAIAKALKINNILSSLILGQNNIGDRGATTIADGLRKNGTLKILILDANKISDIGAKAIAEALKTNTTLTQLMLSDNNIGDDGAITIAEALKTNITLTQLILGTNKINDIGAKAIAEAWNTNETLTQLILTNNNIGNAGATSLLDVLKIKKELKIKLYLDNNKLISPKTKITTDTRIHFE
jgi:hypothetical protein